MTSHKVVNLHNHQTLYHLYLHNPQYLHLLLLLSMVYTPIATYLRRLVPLCAAREYATSDMTYVFPLRLRIGHWRAEGGTD